MIREKAAKVKLLVLDVDGVMTDGTFILNDRGEETKGFHVRDGLGIKLLLDNGVQVVVISGRISKAVEYRASELGILECHQGIRDKAALCRNLIQEKGLTREEVCAVGDDLQDVSVFRESGLPIAVADAPGEVRDAALMVTQNSGGHGAVREVCEFILKAKNTWEKAISPYTK